MSQARPGGPSCTAIGCTVLSGLLFLGLIIGTCRNSEQRYTAAPKVTANSESAPTKIDAWVMAQDFVTDNLKAPSTASFGKFWGGEYQDPEEQVYVIGLNKYKVKGWVDAENAFGANIRTNFLCILQYLGDDRWRCEKIEFDSP